MDPATHIVAQKHPRKNSKRSPRVAIKPKHAVPYRKRHYLLLVASLGTAFVLFGVLVSMLAHSSDGASDAQSFIASTYNQTPATKQAVSSSYGFSFTYDARRLYASAIDGSTGTLYIGYELAQERPYQTVKLSVKSVPHAQNQPNTITLEYYPLDMSAGSKPLTSVERDHAVTAATGQSMPVVITTNVVKQRGISFQKTVWSQQATGPLAKQLVSYYVSYTTVLNGRPLVIKTNSRLGIPGSTSDIDAIAGSLSSGPSVLTSAPTKAVSSKVAASHSLMSSLFFSSASAATLDTQTVSALYAPAVVKIYNAFCTDISVNGQPYLSGSCSASSGSGFFVSADGYIATNGHVATQNPRDLIIQDAYDQATKGNGQALVKLAQTAGLDIDQLKTITNDAELVDTIFNAVYGMPDSAFTKTNNVQNLLVGLNSKDPEIDVLLAKTQARQRYEGDSNIREANLVSSDYRAADGITKYRNSDVALIKVTGRNFPVTILGNLSDVSQGSPLSILGYPVAASDNGVVATHVSQVTLTSGKVSAIKSANGDTRQLVETDTTIGHGNSGGPVLDDNGRVIGIATYTIDGGGQGNGTFNYVRDIGDLRQLASDTNLRFNTSSQTQHAWQLGIAAFNAAHYSSALKYFGQVQRLYPQHPTADDFIARATANIRAGKEVKDFPVAVLIAGTVVALIGAATAITVIIRHHGKHQVYKLASGQAAAIPVNSDGTPISGYYYPVQLQPSSAEPMPVSAQSLHQR